MSASERTILNKQQDAIDQVSAGVTEISGHIADIKSKIANIGMMCKCTEKQMFLILDDNSLCIRYS